MNDPVAKRVEEILIKETVITLCKEVEELKEELAELKEGFGNLKRWIEIEIDAQFRRGGS